MLGMSAEEARSYRRSHREQGPKPDGIAASLLKLASTLRRGLASAGLLVASDEISGFQVIHNPDTATLPELRQELAILRARLEDSLHSGSTAPSPVIDEVRQSLAEAATELARQSTEIHRTLERLGRAADHLHQAGEVARLSDDLTPTLAQLAVSAATLWSIATRIFTAGA